MKKVHNLEIQHGPGKFSVRALNPADAGAYHAVRLRALRENPPAFGSLPDDEPNLSETGTRLAESDDRCFFGAFQDEELVGIARFSRYSAPNEKHRAYLAGLYVLPAFRRNGCGRSLVREALARAANSPGIRRVNLSVVTRQEAAIRLYQSLGFRIYGTEQETFSKTGEFYDEHLMTLDLDLAGRDCGTTPQSGLTGPAATAWSLTSVADTSAPDCDLVCQWLREHNWAMNPGFMEQLQQPEYNAQSLVLLATVDSRVIGGLFAETQFAWLRISIMAVSPEWRSRGVGAALLAAAERQAIARGCEYVYVDTMEYQAPRFYLAHDFRIVGQIPDWDSRSHTKLYLTKRLDETCRNEA